MAPTQSDIDSIRHEGALFAECEFLSSLVDQIRAVEVLAIARDLDRVPCVNWQSHHERKILESPRPG